MVNLAVRGVTIGSIPWHLGPAAVEQFLTHLAVDRKVNASTESHLLGIDPPAGQTG